MTSNEPLPDEVDRLVRVATGRPLPAIELGAPVDPQRLGLQLQHAQELADVSVVPPQQRFGALKGLVMRAARLFLVRQTAFNQQTVDLLGVLNHQIVATTSALDQRFSALSAALVDLELRSDEAAAAAQREIRLLVQELSLVRETMAAIEAEHSALRRLAGAGQPSAALDRRYADFEDRYRGSQDDIQALLEPYLNDIYPLRESGGAVLDLGCGRGEWLRLLATHGIPARGVDMNRDAVAGCVADGLDVVVGECIDHLEAVPAGSLLAVTAFHLVEHLPVPLHGQLIDAAFRALQPGGVLIIETPNPTNLVVGAAAFYRDPTHLRPVHPDSLTFLASESGFERNEIRYLHARPEYDVVASDHDDVMGRETAWALFGPQDFALVGHCPEGESAGL